MAGSVSDHERTGSKYVCLGGVHYQLFESQFLKQFEKNGVIFGLSPTPDLLGSEEDASVGIGGAGISSFAKAFSILFGLFPDAFFQGGATMRGFALKFHNDCHPNENPKSVCTDEMLREYLKYIQTHNLGQQIDKEIDKTIVANAFKASHERKGKRGSFLAAIEAKVICLLAQALLNDVEGASDSTMPALFFFSLTTQVEVAKQRFYQREYQKHIDLGDEKIPTKEETDASRITRYQNDKKRYPKSYEGLIEEYSGPVINEHVHLVLDSTVLTPIELVVEVLHYLVIHNPTLALLFLRHLSYRHLVFYEVVTMACRLLRKIGVLDVHDKLPKFVKNVYT